MSINTESDIRTVELLSADKLPPGFEVLYSWEFIQQKIDELVETFLREYSEALILEELNDGTKKYKKIVLIQILESARLFAADLEDRLIAKGFEVEVKGVKFKSYDGEKQGKLKFVEGEENITNMDPEVLYLIVDDMLDTGKTMLGALEKIRELNEAALSMIAVTLLKKPGARSDNGYDYLSAFEMEENRWIGGYWINIALPLIFGIMDARNYRDIIARIREYESSANIPVAETDTA